MAETNKSTMTKTAKERTRVAVKVNAPDLMPYGVKHSVKAVIKPSKIKTGMRERALRFYQGCLMSSRNILRSLIGSL